MRVNVYAEEMTDRIEIIGKEIDGHTFTGLRFYLELPATIAGTQYSGPFIHRPGDDDSSAVTFWGKRDLRVLLRTALAALDEHYDKPPADAAGQRGEGIGRLLEAARRATAYWRGDVPGSSLDVLEGIAAAYEALPEGDGAGKEKA